MNTEAGWASDPSGAHELRYWDGEQWTQHVSDGGAMTRAPLDVASSTSEPVPRATTPDTTSVSGAQFLGLFKNRWVILLLLFFVGIPAVVGLVVVVTHDSPGAAVEPFDTPELACESWWRANVSAARDGWNDAKLQREVGRIADATEATDAPLARYWRAVAVNGDPTVIRENIELAYQRCVQLQWRGATDAELAIIGSPAPPTR
ncbi:MAG: DUF2510 domain-containing protein [Acidimicrobiales bacterium]